MLLIIFWHIKNLTMCIKQDACWVANSLRHLLASSYKVVEAKEIYFSNFFAHKKLRKIASIDPTCHPLTHLETSRFLDPHMSRNMSILDTRMCTFWCPEPQLSGHVPEHENLKKLQNFAKSRKIAKMSKIAKKYDFRLSKGYPTWRPWNAILRPLRTCFARSAECRKKSKF